MLKEKINILKDMVRFKEETEMPVKIANLTPHPITLVTIDGNKIEVPSSGVVRVQEERKEEEPIAKVIKRLKKSFGKISDEEIRLIKDMLRDNDIVIVSLAAAKSLLRDDRLSEEEKRKIAIVGNTVRDANGRIIGADALSLIVDLE